MLQFIIGLFIGIICGVFTIAIVTVGKLGETETNIYQSMNEGDNMMIEFCGNCQIGAINHRDEPGTCGHYSKCTGKHCASWRKLHSQSSRERVVYICSPLRGDIQENIRRAKEYCKAASNSGAIPIAPHIYLTLFLNDNIPEERQAGMEMGITLLERCDELWVFGEPTEGMRAEIAHAKELRMPINYIPTKTVNELNERSKTHEYQ